MVRNADFIGPSPFVLAAAFETLQPARDLHADVSIQSGLPLTFTEGKPTLPLFTRRLRWRLSTKRLIDIVLSLLCLIVLSPVLATIALMIRATSRGSVIFKQKREGLRGRPIEIYKFRSLYEADCDATGVTQITGSDPRITPFGRFIRQTSLDELPQLINVLRGEMALVGPRPHPYGTLVAGRRYDALVPYYHARQTMKPGITGWAQISGLRGVTDDLATARARIDHDLAYIQNFSLLLDARILATTVTREFLRRSGG